jgi:ribosomal protein L11 methyltransferase
MLEGLPPNGATHCLRLSCPPQVARQIADALVETFPPGQIAASAFQPDPRAAEATGAWILEAYFEARPDPNLLRELIEAWAGPAAAASLVFEEIGAQDWIEAGLRGQPPVRAGRFLVHGSHDRPKIAANALALEIPAALAFGTGHHGTTRGCLIFLDALGKTRRPRRILDVGTGTGVLAMASAKRFHGKVRCGDVDPVAVAVASANARRNGLGFSVRPVLAEGARHPALVHDGPYDVILANILAKPLKAMAGALAGLAARDGLLILSGLLPGDVAGILSRYRSRGFSLAKRLELEGWASLCLRRGGAAARPRRHQQRRHQQRRHRPRLG